MRLFARAGNAILQPALKLNRRLILKCGAQFDPLARRKIPWPLHLSDGGRRREFLRVNFRLKHFNSQHQVKPNEIGQHIAVPMMSGDGSGNHLLLATARPKNCVPILLSELINENALGPPIAFAERVHCIDLSEIMRQPAREVDIGNAMPLGCQLREDGLGVGFDS